jgi:protein SCO1/2
MKSLLLSLMLALPFAAHATTPALKAGLFEPPRAAPELALAASNGKPFRLADYRGKVVALEFGYTHCLEVCPVSLASLVQARALLGAAAENVQVVFVSVDPERDTVPRLRSYLAQFDPGFIGLTGADAQVKASLAAYGIAAARTKAGSSAGYGMAHSSYLYFVDRQGMLRALMPYGRPAADIAHDLRLLLQH